MAASSSMQSIFLANNLVAYGARNNKSVGPFSDGKKEQPSTVTNASKNPPPSNTPFLQRLAQNFRTCLHSVGQPRKESTAGLQWWGLFQPSQVEVFKGQDVFAQISDGGVSLFVGTSILLSVASLIPLFKGVSVESKSDGIMTSDAELLNGRLAMLGLVALALTEYVTGGTLD